MKYYPEGIAFCNRKFDSLDEIKSSMASGEIIEGFYSATKSTICISIWE